MPNRKTPDWLVQTQNKSWEPEILISGITLTFLFILSKNIYNFYAMLIQDFGVFDGISVKLYYLSIVVLTGLKIVLIVHLILRGIWTGFVGLSYVFPDGVKQRFPLKGNIAKKFERPETFVLKIERICSLLFSFIFYSISFISAVFVMPIPLILLFIAGINVQTMRLITLIYIFVLIFALIIVAIAIDRMPRFARAKRWTETSFYSTVMAVYMTNFGIFKSYLFVFCYFLFILFLSLPAIRQYDFENDRPAPEMIKNADPFINPDRYGNLRDISLRSPRAVLNTFRSDKNYIGLFLSYYKADEYTLKRCRRDPALLRKYNDGTNGTKYRMQELYVITVDGLRLPPQYWYWTKTDRTGQKGMQATVPIKDLAPGPHTLRIDKINWNYKKKKMLLVEKWDVIPFEKEDTQPKLFIK